MTIDFNVPGYDIGSEQRRGIEMVVAAHGRGSNGFLLADEMGSGKTLQSLVAMRAIDRRTLVCCPASIVPQWEEKAAEVFPAAEVAVAKGAKSEGAFTDDARLVVISHDLVGRRDNRQVAIDWLGCDGVVVLDECHRMASTGKDPSRRSEAFWGGRDKTDTGIATGRFVLAMSGTPAPNGRHREYHRFLAHVGEATRDWWSYAKRYCGLKKKQVGRDTFVWDEGANSNRREMLAMLMANGVRRPKDRFVAELPPKSWEVHRIPLDSVADNDSVRRSLKQLSLDAADRLVADIGASRAKSFGAAAQVMVSLGQAKAHAIAARVNELVEDGGGPVVCLMRHLAPYSELLIHLRGHKGLEVVATDSPHPAARKEAVDDFQSGRGDVFVSRIGLVGEGVTLTRASQMVIGEMDFVPAAIMQASDRCHRIGQTDRVVVHLLVLDETLDANIGKMVRNKMAHIEQQNKALEKGEGMLV